MEAKIIKIGTSKGIRIPAKVLQHFDNPDKFDLHVTEYGLFLKPIKTDVRNGWRESFIKSNICVLEENVRGA